MIQLKEYLVIYFMVVHGIVVIKIQIFAMRSGIFFGVLDTTDTKNINLGKGVRTFSGMLDIAQTQKNEHLAIVLPLPAGKGGKTKSKGR